MNNIAGNCKELPAKLILKNFYLNKVKILDKALQKFTSSTSLIPKIGIELEFYLLNSDKSKIDDSAITENFITHLTAKIHQNSLIYKIEKEQGISQLEVKTIFTSNLKELCQEIEFIKEQAEKLAFEKNLTISFDSQVFDDDCGSSMQFNISLHNSENENLYFKEKKILENSITSLLSFTNAIMIFLAPNPEDYRRFDEKLNYKLFQSGKYSAPINLSFGIDNRTCAIRIPSLITSDARFFLNSQKRLEYRIASASCDPYLSIAAIISVILQGINDKLALKNSEFKQVYGNAFDGQYNLKAFIKNYDEALSYLSKSNIIDF